MHQQFAIDPELIPEWSNPQNFRYFIEAFAPDAGRFVARFPKHWQRLIEPNLSGLNYRERARAEELRKRLGTLMVRRRGYAWKPDHWLESAIEEHELRPFRAILSRNNPTSHPNVLVGEGISAEEPLWAVNRGDVFPQTTGAIVSCARPLLAASTEAVFVDPYFHPQYPRWLEVLEGLLGCISPGSSNAFPCRVHVKSNDQTAAEFREDCEQFLPSLIPPGVEFKIYRWDRVHRGDRPHPRYILTERGGIGVEGGLDNKPGETTDIRILEDPIWQRRWSEFRDAKQTPFTPIDQWPPAAKD